MKDENVAKAHFIKAYFDDLQNRLAFLSDLHVMGRKDEALMLCCCYIEALGSRASDEPEQKARNYCDILAAQGCNEIWRLVHPKQLKDLLSSKPLFTGVYGTLEPLIDGFGGHLIDPREVLARLDPPLNEQQRSWLQGNIFKGSMANISYERIRCELVHDISGGGISFSETMHNGNPVPNLDFEVLYSSLRKIVEASREKAVCTNKWWFE